MKVTGINDLDKTRNLEIPEQFRAGIQPHEPRAPTISVLDPRPRSLCLRKGGSSAIDAEDPCRLDPVNQRAR